MSDPTQTIGRYRISRELGRGMMGVVYLAHDPDLGRDIALKVIQPSTGSSGEDRSSFEERFFAEARSAARLTHPGIVVVHDVGRDALSGAPFMDALPRSRPPRPDRTLESGLLRIFVDNEAVMRTTFGGEVTRRFRGIPVRRGRMTETLEVPPGRHTVRVEVSWDDNVRSAETETSFRPGGRLSLRASLGSIGGLRKNLSLEWN